MPPSLVPRLFLIDTFGLIFRAYHARARSGAPAMRTRSGLPTEAVYIFNSMVRKLVEEQRPEYMAAVFESAAPTFRDEMYKEYKANREAIPPELTEQLPYIRRLLDAMRVPVLEYPRFEADDVIGALAWRAAGIGIEVCIVTSDKDLLQLVRDRVYVLNPMKDSLVYDVAKVSEAMGVRPDQVADLLALKGDAVDNIPGAPGIGDKGARDLVQRFGSVEQALERAAEVERRTYRESLQQNRDQVLLSKKLATIDTSVPVEMDLESARVVEPDVEKLQALYGELEFHSLLRELAPAAPASAADYGVVETKEELRQWWSDFPAESPLAMAPALAHAGEIGWDGVGLAARPGQGRLAPLEAARRLLEDPDIPKLVHDHKGAWKQLDRRGIALAGVAGDTRLACYLLDPTRSGYSLSDCVLRYFSRTLEGGHGQAGMPVTTGPAEAADFTRRLADACAGDIDTQGLREVYESIELPLVAVLARMEKAGVAIDRAVLDRLAVDMRGQLDTLTAEIHRLAGHPFNINSPQQLGKVLFEELNLPVPARTGKTRAPSTAADVLDELAPQHEIVRHVLEFRQLAKLLGTYVEALPALIHPATGRLHTTFDQCGSATGRLSSSDPNLQNIPIRTEAGRQIRAAFVPRPGWRLLSADYSQIELRVLAHVSRDPVLIEAFRRGEDIHTRTAAEVMGVPPLMVTAEDRRRAKAVNFGIVYGLSAFGLANQLGISRSEAQTYIDGYFARYAGVKRFIDSTIAEVRRTGITRTLFGRLRAIPDMSSRHVAARNFAERTAVNSPMQGTAADLIKLAMIRIDRRLAEKKLESVMLLQVHDELLFETPPGEVEALSRLVKHEMESVKKLDVPLLVGIGVGDNWRDVK